MFIIYSPEGQSFIGASQAIPALKVDPAKRINDVEDNVLDGVGVEAEEAKGRGKGFNAVNAYVTNQKDRNRRVVVKVSEVMTSPVEVITSENSLEDAWNKMQENNIAHLPVMRLDMLIGICSQTDLLGRVIVDKSGALEGVKQELVSDIMKTQVITTQADTDIRHVARVLTEYEIGALVVMNDYQQPMGIVTRGDLIKRLSNDPPVELYI
ncbi:MAG: acetoin utilization protein AcuB [Thiomicrorhabdus sp.]|nr:MAG: acetoin utilization protein AcuB [Thiomicrorhabdus sp.]